MKTGGSRHTAPQRAKDGIIGTSGGDAVGENARKARVVGPLKVTATLERYQE